MLRPTRWRERIQGNTITPVTAERRLAALGETLNALEQRFGTWRVTWGELNRLQRRDESKGEQFDDARPSLGGSGRRWRRRRRVYLLRRNSARTEALLWSGGRHLCERG